MLTVLWFVSTPEIHFPITVTERQEKALIKMEVTRDRKRKAEKMIGEENGALKKLEKKLKKNTNILQLWQTLRTDQARYGQ